MSFTKLSKLSPSRYWPLLLLAKTVFLACPVWAQVVPSQANIDASAQRRLQDTAEQARQLRRTEEQTLILSRALSAETLSGPRGPVLTRQALAAMVRLREMGVGTDEALRRATRTSGIGPDQAAGTTAYFRGLFSKYSGKITPSLLSRLEAGTDPAPELILAPFAP